MGYKSKAKFNIKENWVAIKKIFGIKKNKILTKIWEVNEKKIIIWTK